MGRQNEFYKKTHPEQFSDSVLVKKGNLSRDMFDYYLESLTSRNLEKTFEEFCRKLAESEVCPNLLPQTGPTGGGDSKVDSETYPVSKEISDRWYFGNTAASERWAFAISAKKDWQSKVKSDVVKIVSVNQQEGRGYTKIFFMSNQYVPDKKRAQVEDELRNLHGLDIRILDRNWILDKVFSSPQNIDMTISVFGFSESFRDEVKMGSQDLKRKQEFEENEQILASQQTKQSELVSLAQRNVILARELEYPLHQLLGLIDRSIRLSAEKGSTIDHANAVRDAAWTVYWWYEDKNHYYRFYKDYEKLVVESQNVHLFIDLITLWINLFSLSLNDNTFSIDEHTQILKDEYSRYTGDPSKPNTAIEAKAAFQLIRFFLGDDPDTIVDDIILILKASSGHLDLDIRPLCRAIQEFPVFENTKRFPEMFERSVDDSQNIVHEQELFSDFMSGLLAEVISIMFPIPSELAKIEKMVQNDAAFDRSGVFANSPFFGMEVLGKEAFYYPALVHDYPCLEMTRTQKSPITSASRLETAKPAELPQNVVFDVPLNTDFAKISNTNMYTSSIINIPAWNQAQWKGVMFMAYKGHCVPPVLSFVFGTDYGKAIWEDWRKLMGNHDINNRLGIRIIKGIDRKHPNWYRVAIGPNSFSSDSGEDLFIASLPMRLHTMQPSSDANLKMFESEFGKYREFFLCPAYMPDRTAEPSVYTELAIKMNRESIIICNASDILENDFLSVCAIIPGDDPIIPKDKENSPIMGILRRKKSDRN